MKLSICFLLFCTLCAGVPDNPNENTNGILKASVVGGVSGYGLEILLNKLNYIDRNLLELKLKLDQHWELMESIKAFQEKTLATTATAATTSIITPIMPPAMQTPKTTGTEKPTPATSTTPTTLPPTTTTITTTTTAKPTPTTTLKPSLPSSCKVITSETSGVYLISVNNDSAPFNVYCEMEKFGGGWIVVQHRFDGSVDFYQNWTQYRDGFGQLDKEFWLGLEQIHQLTNTRSHELMVEIKDFSGNYGYAHYSVFAVGSESIQYRLKTARSYNGTAGDGMAYNQGEKFSTKDSDNDQRSNMHWAVHYHGGWWNGYLGSNSNLNGQYKNANDEKSNWWWSFKNDMRGFSFTRMMIREL